MRIGCSLKTFDALSMEIALRRIHAAGYSAIELSWDAYDTIAGRALQLGLDTVAVRISGFDTCNDALPSLEQSRIKRVIVTAGPRRQSLDAAANKLRALAERAADHDVTILIANAKDSRVEQLEDLRCILKTQPHPNLRVLIDVGHYHQSIVNPIHVIGEFGDLTEIVRISDRVGPRHVAFGKGEVNIPTVIDTLCRCEYTGWLIAEPAADAIDIKSLTGTRIYLYHTSTLLG